MKGLCIALAILLALYLIGLIRIRMQAQYSGEGAYLWVKLLCFRFRLVPPTQKPKKNKGRRAKPEKEAKPEEKKSRGGALSTIRELLPVIIDALNALRRKITADVLRLELIIAADDPADAALRYGQASALLGAMWQPLTRVLNVADGSAHVDVDFDGHEPSLYLFAQLSLTIGQAVVLVAVYGLKATAALIRARSRTHQGKADD